MHARTPRICATFDKDINILRKNKNKKLYKRLLFLLFVLKMLAYVLVCYTFLNFTSLKSALLYSSVIS